MHEFIHPESIIMSDEWGAYDNVNMLYQGYEIQTVNYSKKFVCFITGTCANRIESKWCKLKKIPKRRYSFENADEEILVQVWHHQNKGNLWNAF